MSTPRPSYLVRTPDIPFESLRHVLHPANNSNHRYTASLGDSTGLTKLGVHFCRLPPGATSSTLHYHTVDDEWYYIIDAGGDDSDAVILLWEPSGGDKDVEAAARVPREEKIKAGDFYGFKGGAQGAHAHALRAGTKEVVYLVGGTRVPMDHSVYPLQGMRIVTDRAQGGLQAWSVEEKNLTPINIKPPTTLD